MTNAFGFSSESRRTVLRTPDGEAHALAVRCVGPLDAVPLLFLHGFPTSGLDWAPIVPAFTHFRCIVPDLLGFGGSDKPRLRYSYELQADLIGALLWDMQVQSVIIVAHDYSVTLAQELLRREQAGALSFRIVRTVFLNGGVYGHLHRPQPIQRMLLLPGLGGLIAVRMTDRSLLAGLRRVAGRADRWTEVDAAIHFSAIAENNGAARLPRLLHYIADRKRDGAPWEAAMEAAAEKIAFIWGEADPVSGEHVSDHVRLRLPHVPIWLFPDVGHYPQWEAPEETIAALTTILKDVP